MNALPRPQYIQRLKEAVNILRPIYTILLQTRRNFLGGMRLLSQSTVGNRMATVRLAITKLVNLLEDQTAILRQIEQRQAAADLSRQSIPQVPKASSSTWGTLLRSSVAEIIQPNTDRWRSGLDALLVFLGLFSAIVTAFLVQSLPGLQPDEVARTNELLANLTEIVILLGGGAAVLELKPPATFQPTAVTVRLNSYWSVSLILSLSVAALAVTLRGFINLLALSTQNKPVDKLVDIRSRWNAAEKILGPATEAIPQLLVIPVVLFVAGLLDQIFTAILTLAVLPIPIVVASVISLLSIAGVVLFLAFTFLDASARPNSSPFQSTLARIVRTIFEMASCLGQAQSHHPDHSPDAMALTYHEIVQSTHDDETLDKAAAVLSSIIDPRPQYYSDLNAKECETLVHLLSPEASIRCNHTVAEVIIRLEHIFSPVPGQRVPWDSTPILFALTRAARRSVHRLPLASLWTSPFLRAMAVITGAYRDNHPPVVCILGSRYMHYRDFEILDLLFEILEDFCPPLASRPFSPALVALFEPPFIVPRYVLESLHHLPSQTDQKKDIVSLLMAAKTPRVVIGATHELLHFSTSDLSDVDVLFIYTTVGLVVEVCLADLNFDECLLETLCSHCILALKDRLDVGLSRPDDFFPILDIMRMAMSELPPSPALPVLEELMVLRDRQIERSRSSAISNRAVCSVSWYH
ncbi:hypothetical protein FB451DRAFT_1399066 [Mycena latifolia]|nr:hypothetical protein FB451DRAFT_1399066 [Mycena latifolia]